VGKRLSKIYTRTGDSGETGLGDGSRIKKDHARIVAIGSIDELNSYLGFCIEEIKETITKFPSYTELQNIELFLSSNQHRIFDLGGEISIPGYQIISDVHIERIEEALDQLNAHLLPLENFILPGGHKVIAALHLCRSICRRAERDLVSLQSQGSQSQKEVNKEALQYLNRLSDYLFVAARYSAKVLEVDEILWQKDQ